MTKRGQLFGEDEDAGGELDEAEQQGENGKLNYMTLTTDSRSLSYLN